MQKIKMWWEHLTGEQRRKIKKYGSISIILVVLFCTYYLTGQQHHENSTTAEEHEIKVEDDLLEADMRSNLNQQINSVNETVSAQNKKIEALNDLMSSLTQDNEMMRSQMTQDTQQLNVESEVSALPQFPSPPALPPIDNMHQSDQMGPLNEPFMVGSIGHVNGVPIDHAPPSKKNNTIFLPPSFMPATLLTGIDAMTTELGQGNPETIIFRVQAPAILPNSLKANLKGCFVVANAFGNLAKERVQVRLVSLHCMALSGEAVIDQQVKGFVADKDGKRDMSGIVVTKAGSNLARSFVAGIAGGIGDVAALAGSTTVVNPLGATQVLDPAQALQSGLGDGVKSSTNELQRYYLDLAKQATPVIEIGTAKEVTVVIQEGVELEIKDYSYEI